MIAELFLPLLPLGLNLAVVRGLLKRVVIGILKFLTTFRGVNSRSELPASDHPGVKLLIVYSPVSLPSNQFTSSFALDKKQLPESTCDEFLGRFDLGPEILR